MPKGINRACVRLLAKEPNQRYPDAAALIADLERVRKEPERMAASPEEGGDDGRSLTVEETVVDEAAPTTVKVPDLCGQELSQARGTLAEARLSLGEQERTPSATIAEDEVIRKRPEVGTEVQAGSSVSVTVSSGLQEEKSATIPDDGPQQQARGIYRSFRTAR